MKEEFSVATVFQRKKKESLGNYKPVSFTSVPEKVLEKNPCGSISSHMKEEKMIGSTQQKFIKCRSCLSNVMAFCAEMTGSMDKGRAVDAAYLKFSKAFDMVSRNILRAKLMIHELHGRTIR